MNTKYFIKKILNNNVILAEIVESHEERILIGKGIGFAKKNGMTTVIEEHLIDKSFQNFDEDFKNKFIHLINDLNKDIIQVCEEIIKAAEEKFGQLNPHIYISLTDHVSMAIERLKSGMGIDNPFLDQIKVLFEEEYKIAERGAAWIQMKFDIVIPEAEIGFIAFHLHSAKDNRDVKSVVRDTRILTEVYEIILEEGYRIQESSNAYALMTKYLLTILEHKSQEEDLLDELSDIITKRFSRAHKLCQKICKHVESSNNTTIQTSQRKMLTLYLNKVIKECSN